MSDVLIRGYVLLSAARHLRSSAGENKTKELLELSSPGLRDALAGTTSASWCTSSHIGELYRMIAALAEGDENRARALLIACGRVVARDASNTFLRLLRTILTPSLLAKKLPDMWARDCTGGKVEAEVDHERIESRIFGVDGFDHLAPVAAGYVISALEAMGKSIIQTELHDWSLVTPAPSNPRFEIVWHG
jgi:hypothetical protein